MKTCTVLCAVLMLAAAGLTAQPSTEYVNSLELKLPCTIVTGPAGLKEIEIWMTADQGQTWVIQTVKSAADGVLTCKVDKDGVYGFKSVAVAANGRKEAAPRAGDAPDIKFVVDTVKPVITLKSSTSGNVIKPGESVTMTWNVSDANIRSDRCQVLFSADGGKIWGDVAMGRLEGSREFAMTAFINPAVFRVTAEDLAGNTATEVIAFSIQGEGKGRPAAVVQVPVEPPAAVVRQPAPADDQAEVIQLEVIDAAEETMAPAPAATVLPAAEGEESTLAIIDEGGDGYFETVVRIEGDYYAPAAPPDNKQHSATGDEVSLAEEVVIIDKGASIMPERRLEKPAPMPVPAAAVPVTPVQVNEAVDGRAVQYCDKALEREVLGDLANAEKLYVEALRLEPKYYRARRSLCDLYLRADAFSKALSGLDGLLQLNPEDVKARVDYGYCLYRLGQAVEAEAQLKRALGVDAANVDAMWYLSKIYKDIGKLDDAVYLWLRIVKRGSDNNKWFSFAKNYLSIYAGSALR